MPLLGRKPYIPAAPSVPEDIKDRDVVFVVRLTGEVFTDYDAYLEQLSHYMAAKWTCAVTGRGGLTYKQALLSEQDANKLLEQFPAELEGPFSQLVQHSTLRLEELVTRLADVSKSYKLSAASAADPSTGKPGKQAPLAKPVIKLWLHEAATWTGRYWSVKSGLCTKYGFGGMPEETAHEEEDCEGQAVGGRRGRGRAASPVEGRRLGAAAGGGSGGAREPYASLADGYIISAGPGRPRRKKAPSKALEEEQRAKPGTTKYAALQVLRICCPPDGLSVEQVIKLSMERGIKTDWPPGGRRNLYHVMHTDPAFLRISRNTYVLSSLYPDVEEWVEDIKEKPEGGRGKKPIKREVEAGMLIPMDGGNGDYDGGPAGGGLGGANISQPGVGGEDSCVLQRLELQLQHAQRNVAACRSRAEVALVAESRGRLAEAAQQRLATAHSAAVGPEVLMAATHAIQGEHRQLAEAMGEVEAAQRALEVAMRGAEDAEKRVLRERLRQSEQLAACVGMGTVGHLDLLRSRFAMSGIQCGDAKEQHHGRAGAASASVGGGIFVGRRIPSGDAELLADAADVVLTPPYTADEGRRLGDSLYLADLLFQLGGELGLRVVRYAHVDTLLLGGRNPLSILAAAEQIIAAKEYAEEVAQAAAVASAMAAGAPPSVSKHRKDSKSKCKKAGGAAATAAAATAAAAVIGSHSHAVCGGVGDGDEEAIIVDRVGDPTLLSDLYVQLLKNLLMDVWECSAMTRWERRWLEVLEEGSWAEVLRRYAILRAATANREPLTTAAIAALASLGRSDPESLAGEEHVALLLMLVEDLMEMERMRNWMQRRLDYGTSVAAGLRADIAEDRKKLRELVVAEKEAKKRKREGPDAAAAAPPTTPAPVAPAPVPGGGKRTKLSGTAAALAAAHLAAAASEDSAVDEAAADDADPPEPGWELPNDLRVFSGDLADRRAVANFRARLQAARQRIERSRAQWQAHQRRRAREREARRRHLEPVDQRVAQEKREAEEALIARQEALDREMERCNTRRTPLGSDRHHRRYWWGLAGLRSLVLVEHCEGMWSAISTPEDLEALMYSLDARGASEAELRRALEKAQPAILSAMCKVRQLMNDGEAVVAADNALAEAADAMEGYGLDGEDGGGLFSGPYRGPSLRQLVSCVVEMTTLAEAEDMQGPSGGWRDWRQRFNAVVESGELDVEWSAADEAVGAGFGAAGDVAMDGRCGVRGSAGGVGDEAKRCRVYSQLSRRLLELQRWFFAHSGQEGHPRFTEHMPAPGGTTAAAIKAAAAAAAAAEAAEDGGAADEGTMADGEGAGGMGSSESEGDEDGDDGLQGHSEAPQDGDEDGEDDGQLNDRMHRRQLEITLDDNSPELVDRDLTRDEEKSRSSNGFCRHFMWRSKREQAAWVGMAGTALTAPRLAFCSATLAFHSAGLLGKTLTWAKKPKKH